MFDLLPQNIQGPWEKIKKFPLMYLFYDDLSFDNAYCWFNCQFFDPAKIPVNQFEKFVFSFHTEFLEHEILHDFFSAHSNKNFLLISEWNFYDRIFPSNVQTVTWITLHVQAEYILRTHGHCEQKTPRRRLSSLSYRHELHKAAVTAYLLSHANESDRILSWWNRQYRIPYYLEPNYYLDPEIAKYVLNPSFQNHPPIMLDEFNNRPLANCQWRHPAYLDCVFNLSNESVFNSSCGRGRIPGPYLTDKTWKVLLSGTGLLPVGQTGTVEHLRSLGLEFDYQIDLTYDSLIPEYDRMLGIFRAIDTILGRPINQLQQDIKDSTTHNIDHIINGQFKKTCQDYNESQKHLIEKWVNL